MSTQALRRATGTLHRLPEPERSIAAGIHIGRNVIVSWNGLRDRDNARLTRGRLVAVAHPVSGGSGTTAMVILCADCDQYTDHKAISVATIFSIEVVS